MDQWNETEEFSPEEDLHREEKQKKGMLIAMGGLLVLAVVLFLVLTAMTGGFGGGSDDPSQTESQQESESEGGTTEEPESIPAADIGDVNDKGDPQKEERPENGQGAQIKVEDLSKPSGEAQAVSLGIDVSKWQGKIDWKQVKASGVEFAMIRVGYRTSDKGVLCEDPYARYNLQEATAAGVKVGVYFFSTAITRQEALEEAAWVAEFIAPYAITYPVAYDCEGFSSESSRMFGINSSKRTSYAKAFMDYVKAKGYTPMLYGPKNDLEDVSCWQMAGIEGNYKVWAAQYPAVPYPETKASTYSGQLDMWQHTDRGRVPGISGNVDLNVAYFGYSQAAKPKDPTPADKAEIQKDPEAGITFQKVNEQVTAKEAVNLRTAPTTKEGSEVVVLLKNGEVVTRTGIGHNGWSRVEYKGQTLYAVTSYLKLYTGQEEESTQESTQSGLVAGITFTSVNEQVTAKEATNLRTEPSTKGGAATVVVQIKNGEWVTRTGIGDNGWSRLEYNGQVVYAVTSYLTTDQAVTGTPETYREVNEKVTPKIEVNLRTEPSSEKGAETVVALVKNGEILTRTGVGSQGWSRLEYNGQVVYAVTDYLMAVEE